METVILDNERMFPSDYIAGVDIALKGRDITLTIKEVVKGEVVDTNGKKKRKGILHFEKTDKKLVLNRTNATSIAKLYGTNANDWIGKKVTLYAIRDRFFGKDQDAVRIRESAPQSAAKPQENQ